MLEDRLTLPAESTHDQPRKLFAMYIQHSSLRKVAAEEIISGLPFAIEKAS